MMKHLRMFLILSSLVLVLLPWMSITLRLKYTGYWRLAVYLGYCEDDTNIVHEMQVDNTERVKMATSYFKQMGTRDQKKTNTVDIVICIVSVDRDGEKDYKPRYLLQSAALYHKETIRPDNYLTSGMIICDVNDKKYREAEYLSSFLPVVVRRKQQPSSAGLKILEKEKQDYLFCMKSAMAMYNASYILMVEDDTLPLPGFFRTLHQLLQRKPLNKVGFIKLYHPKRLLGYLNPEPHRWFEWVSLATLIVLMYYLIFKYDLPSPTIIFLYILLTMFLLELVGRQTYLWLLPQHSLVPAPDCCTQANIYPTNTIHTVMEWLEGVKCSKDYAKDYALVDMIGATGLRSLYVQPSLVQHVGAYSSLHTGVDQLD